MYRSHILSMLLLFFVLACGKEAKQTGTSETKQTYNVEQVSLPDSFSNYWYSGKAEISTYQLEQARYGDIHTGHATFIFVTEPFSKSKQVKLDNAAQNPEDAINVMKLNFTRKFNTGIYPYSTMLSSFTPIQNEEIRDNLKLTFSAQEWCGQSFIQLNREAAGDYTFQAFSYFESEGDREGTLRDVLLEDEIWNTIRINPDELPVGNLKMVPGMTYIRLRHQPIQGFQVEAKLKKQEGETMNYLLNYPDLKRQLSITFDADFPYTIRSWKEVTPSGFGEKAETLTTSATLMKQMKSAYWQQNKKNDRSLRSQLNLPENYQ